MATPDSQPTHPAAHRLYRVVLWSPLFFALSAFLVMATGSNGGGSLTTLACAGVVGLTWVCGLPLGLLVQLFLGLTHQEALVRWHTAQWGLINILGGGVGLLLLAIFYNLFLLPLAWLAVVYGLNWWSDRQASRGACWLRDLLGSDRPATATAPPVAPLSTGRRVSALHLAVLLKEFRLGSPAMRQAAFRELERLGEVEEF